MRDLAASDLMTPDPVAVPPAATLAEVTARMVDHRVSEVPVIDGDRRVVGILTEGDLLRRAELGTARHAGWLRDHFASEDAAALYVRAHSRQVADIMTAPVHCVAAATPLADVIATMTERNIRSLPVTRDDVLVGIVSRWDVIRRLDALLRQPDPGPGPASDPASADEVIAARIQAALAAEKWAPYGITAHVHDGEVALEGCARTETDLQALRVLAGNVPGVKRVRDTLFLLSPGTGWSRPADL